MKSKTNAAILICTSMKTIRELSTAPGTIPAAPTARHACPQVVIGFPNRQPQTANQFAPSTQNQRNNDKIIHEGQRMNGGILTTFGNFWLKSCGA